MSPPERITMTGQSKSVKFLLVASCEGSLKDWSLCTDATQFHTIGLLYFIENISYRSIQV
jgi:hypothetical protein